MHKVATNGSTYLNVECDVLESWLSCRHQILAQIRQFSENNSDFFYHSILTEKFTFAQTHFQKRNEHFEFYFFNPFIRSQKITSWLLLTQWLLLVYSKGFNIYNLRNIGPFVCICHKVLVDGVFSDQICSARQIFPIFPANRRERKRIEFVRFEKRLSSWRKRFRTCLYGKTRMSQVWHICAVFAQELLDIQTRSHFSHRYSPKQRPLPWYGVFLSAIL